MNFSSMIDNFLTIFLLLSSYFFHELSICHKVWRYAFSVGQFFEGLTASVNAKAQDAVDDVICDGAGHLFEDYVPQLKTVFFKGD